MGGRARDRKVKLPSCRQAMGEPQAAASWLTACISSSTGAVLARGYCWDQRETVIKSVASCKALAVLRPFHSCLSARIKARTVKKRARLSLAQTVFWLSRSSIPLFQPGHQPLHSNRCCTIPKNNRSVAFGTSEPALVGRPVVHLGKL